MSRKTIILDTSTLNNLYYGGGKSSWDNLIEHYDTVVIPDAVGIEMTRYLGMYPKDDDFNKWRKDNELKLELPRTEVLKDHNIDIVGLGSNDIKKKQKNLGEKSIAEIAEKSINNGIYPIIASDENNVLKKADASKQVEEITPIKTPEIMNEMLDRNTITPTEYENFAKNSDASRGSQFNKADFRDLSKPYDRKVERMDAAREIGELAPKAKAEADQALEAALKDSSPDAAAKVTRAEKEKDWVDREGTIPVLAGKLAEVEGETITVRVEPGATSIGRLQALSNGIDAEVVQQQQQEQVRVAEPVLKRPLK